MTPTEEILASALKTTWLTAVTRPFPKCYGGAPPRKKMRGARGRKRALYASLTGHKTIRIRQPNMYVRAV